jgi:hypothetical protein
MITKILIAIETVMNLIYPQNRFQPCFAKQEEFCFVQKSPLIRHEVPANFRPRRSSGFLK